MARTILASDADRLPWLNDDVRRPKRSSSWVAAFVAASTVAVIAALSFWLGMNGLPRGLSLPMSQGAPDARVDVPPAELGVFAQDQVMPEVEPSPVPGPVALPLEGEVRPSTAVAPPVRRVAAKRAAAVHRSRPARAKAASSKSKKPAEDAKVLKYANPWKSRGVSGRMVRVGAYGSMERGKEAWSRLAQLSPAIKELPAVVTDIPSPTGRTLYWLQIGTTSQAHSEVLCQRMRAIGQRCVVVDLAGARKDNRNGRQPVGI
jgi:hypothetical protein